MAIASYPHVEMHVRDDSIYTPTTTEVLPLNKPLYMMRTARGPVGVPVWCATYTDAVKVFGADTFNKHSKYYSENAYFLTKTFPYNGAFIMRVTADTAVNANVRIEIGLSKEKQPIKQWKRDTNGNFETNLDGSKIPVNSKGQTKKEWEKDPGTETTFVQATLDGYKIAWRGLAGVPSQSSETSSDMFNWYPMVYIEASNPGVWGGSYGVRMFFDPATNTLADTQKYSALKYSLSPMELLQDATVPTAVIDSFGQTTSTGVIKPDVTDTEMGIDLSLDKRVKAAYTGKQALPLTFTYYTDNWNTVGKILMANEISNRDGIYGIYKNGGCQTIESPGHVVTAKTYVDELFNTYVVSEITENPECGFMTNLMSAANSIGVPYFLSTVVDSTDDLIVLDDDSTSGINPKDVFVPTSDSFMSLGGGHDGGVDDIPHDYEVEEYMRAHILRAVAQSHDYLNDYWRCPFNVMYDTGWSFKTKKAVMDFTAVRDDLVAVISTQVTWKAEGDDGSAPVANSQQDDYAYATSLRAYAILMKEDTENGVGACRIKIFCHAGKTSDHDDKWVPYTLWLALKNAQYLNKDYIDQEPKELPFSSVDCFTETSWTAAQEDTKARTWNAGVNYVQYYDMSNVHFAAVRSVYTYETSILVDSGVVDALTFMKNITRRSWSTFAGSTRKAAELNSAITGDLNSRLAYMLHGKFEHGVNVYQTTEDSNLGYARHVDLTLTAPGQNRAWKATIICKREGFDSTAA